MPTPSLSNGSVLQGRYRVKEPIKAGGMGVVYRAEDLRLGVPVAIKVASSDSADRRRFIEREARLLAGLRHSGLPHVFDLFTEQDQCCVVMQFIPGEDLGSVLSRYGAQSPVHVLDWADQLLDVLSYLHGQQPAVIHGDIKPQNLRLTARGEIVLVDFGTAVGAGESTPPSAAFAFSVYYAPPEQLRGGPPEPRSDLFSTAASIYHLLTGSHPADAQTRMQTASQRRPEALRPAHELSRNVSMELSEVLAQALTLDPEMRPPSAAEFRRMLSVFPRAAVSVEQLTPAPLPAPKEAPTAVSPAVQAKIFDRPRYEVKKLLGEGGMGQVFLALDSQHHRTVCLKRLRPSVSNAALRQECAAIARLHHPNIVKLFDYQLDSPEPYMVTEFIEGIALSTYMERHKPVPAPVAIEIGKRLLHALSHAHERSVLHCDLKPENIMLTFDGAEITPKILDFGLAIVERLDDRGNTTGAGRLAGTPIYMAPEQFQGKVLSAACDVYAIALIIAEMLTGEKAFVWDGEGLAVIAQAKLERPFAVGDLRTSVSGLPAPIARALRENTALEPQDRATAGEFLQVLQEAVPAVPAPQVWAPLTDWIETPNAGPPPGWFDSAGFVGGVSLDYECTTEALSTQPGTRPQIGIRLRSTARNMPDDFASLMQRCPAWHLVGSKISFSGWLQAEAVSGFVSLWLRIDGQGGTTLFFDNMNERALRGTTPWTQATITVEIPRTARWLNYGILLSGQGTARATMLAVRVIQSGSVQDLSLWDAISYK